MSEPGAVNVFVRPNFGEMYVALVGVLFRRFGTFIFILLALSALLFVGLYSRPQPDAEWAWILSNAKPLLVLVVIFPVTFFIGPLITARKIFADERYNKGSQCFFSDAGVHQENRVINSSVTWEAFVKATETKSAFYLFPQKNYVWPIPKRCFSSVSDTDQFRELLRAHIAQVKLQRSTVVSAR